MQGQHGHLRRAEAAGLPATSTRLAAGRYCQGDRLHRADGGRDGARRQAPRCEAVRLGARPGCLTIRERERILVGIGRGESLSAIARALGRSPSTVTREVNANGGREHYPAWRGHQRPASRHGAPSPASSAGAGS